MACVRVEEQEGEPPEKDRRIRRVARGQEAGERGVNVAEQWSQRRPEARGPRSAGMGAARRRSRHNEFNNFSGKFGCGDRLRKRGKCVVGEGKVFSHRRDLMMRRRCQWRRPGLGD